jgi:hypothetical protein
MKHDKNLVVIAPAPDKSDASDIAYFGASVRFRAISWLPWRSGHAGADDVAAGIVRPGDAQKDAAVFQGLLSGRRPMSANDPKRTLT